MKYLLFLSLLLALSGCGRFDRFMAGITGDASETCVDGVVYLQFTSGATVKYTYDSLGNFAPARCK
jgi:hypothetical protein